MGCTCVGCVYVCGVHVCVWGACVCGGGAGCMVLTGGQGTRMLVLSERCGLAQEW